MMTRSRRPPARRICAHQVSVLVVVINGMRLLRSKRVVNTAARTVAAAAPASAT